MRIGASLLLILLGTGHSQVPRKITGTYRNPALGYMIKVPSGLVGETGDQAGPERGIKIPLFSGGEISVFGEPNTLEWKTPEDGVKAALGDEHCKSDRRNDVSRVSVGKSIGARGNLVCDGRLIEMRLMFRNGVEPAYWLILRTDLAHATEDRLTFDRFAATFRVIPWQ